MAWGRGAGAWSQDKLAQGGGALGVRPLRLETSESIRLGWTDRTTHPPPKPLY